MLIGCREKFQPGLVPAGNGATFLLGGFIDVLYYLQIRVCHVLQEILSEIFSSTLMIPLGAIPSLEAILISHPTHARDGGLYEKGK